MQRFFPDVKYAWALDTYTWSQNYIHFVPSFALEVLCWYLNENKKWFNEISQNFGLESGIDTFHDALYDAKAAATLFVYLCQHMQMLLQTYPQLAHIRERADRELFYECIIYNKNSWKAWLQMPLLQRSITTPQIMVKKQETPDLWQYPSWSQIYIGDLSAQELATIIAQHKNMICVFSHKAKADIVKHHLHDMWVYGIATLYEELYFDPKRFDILMKKSCFTREEAIFLSKYLSHHAQWLGIFDIQQDYEKRIIYFLQGTRPNTRTPLIFATHAALYNHRNRYPEFYDWYTICFFDQDWRYTTYNDFSSHVYDLEYFIKVIENIVYTYDVCYQTYPDHYYEKRQAIQNFYSFLQIFVWVLSMDTYRLFSDYGWLSIQLDPPLYHYVFYRTQKLRDRMLRRKQYLQDLLPTDVFDDINSHIQQLTKILSSIVTIQRRDHPVYWVSFLYKETNRYIQRDEFQEFFMGNRILFFSNQQKGGNMLLSISWLKSNDAAVRISSNNAIEIISKNLENHNSLYIVSTQKYMSQSLFDHLCEHSIHKNALVLAENITWGVGKNIFLAQHASKSVSIGGYGFFLQMLSKRLYVDKVLIFFIKWAMEKLLLRDIQRYGSKK
jgi:hypothetical protein